MDWMTLIAPVTAASVIGGIVSFAVALVTRSATLRANSDKLSADREAIERRVTADIEMAMQKLAADRDKSMSDKAWADYGLRRDAYIEVARQIDCLFDNGDPNARPELHRTARRVRLIGSDEVVKALNALFLDIREGRSGALDQGYRKLFNAMRRDIRQLHALPPEGTVLDENAFPIES